VCGSSAHIPEKLLIEVFSVGSDDFFVPEEGIFSASGEVSGIIIMSVDIDEAVSLSHFAGAG
jgi:hypothetical protein